MRNIRSRTDSVDRRFLQPCPDLSEVGPDTYERRKEKSKEFINSPWMIHGPRPDT